MELDLGSEVVITADCATGAGPGVVTDVRVADLGEVDADLYSLLCEEVEVGEVYPHHRRPTVGRRACVCPYSFHGG